MHQQFPNKILNIVLSGIPPFFETALGKMETTNFLSFREDQTSFQLCQIHG